MSKKILRVIFYCIYVLNNYIICDGNEDVDSKNPLPFFRRQIEETVEEHTLNESVNDDQPNNLVSFLVNNVKEIFNDLVNDKETFEPYSIANATTFSLHTNAFTTVLPNVTRTHSYLNTMIPNKKNTLTTLLDRKPQETIERTGISDIGRDELMHLSKDLKYFYTTDTVVTNKSEVTLSSGNSNSKSEIVLPDTRRSCIACNNVVTEDCYDPKHKLIPSVVCERDEDLCYSQHTPFGVIDRGCFNANHNLTTYVCSCNLCNYISISEMPYIYSNKQDWVDNVVELSRTRHFTKSVFKDMSCLKCEVNTTTKIGNMLDNANCLEGNIGNVPTEVCGENEICAVKAQKNHGYMWRGCVKSPLYNYWLALCDSDLCNYDALVSIYDEN